MTPRQDPPAAPPPPKPPEDAEVVPIPYAPRTPPQPQERDATVIIMPRDPNR